MIRTVSVNQDMSGKMGVSVQSALLTRFVQGGILVRLVLVIQNLHLEAIQHWLASVRLGGMVHLVEDAEYVRLGRSVIQETRLDALHTPGLFLVVVKDLTVVALLDTRTTKKTSVSHVHKAHTSPNQGTCLVPPVRPVHTQMPEPQHRTIHAQDVPTTCSRMRVVPTVLATMDTIWTKIE